MAHFRAAIFDRSTEYIDRFLIYVKNRHRLPFDVYGFTREDALQDFVKTGMTDMLIISESESLLRGQLAGMTRSSIVLTDNGDAEPHAAGEHTVMTGRYQSMKNIIGVMLDMYGELSGSISQTLVAGINVNVIMSFSGTDAKISTALQLAHSFTNEGKTLYIETERFSGLTKEYEFPAESGFAEVIYLFKTGSSRMKEALEKAVFSTEKMDILAAVCVTEDLEMIDAKEWPDFLKAVADAGGYTTVILGITDLFTSIITTLQMCRNMYICGADETYAPRLKVRLLELEQYFRDMGREDLLKKIMISTGKGKNE